MEEMKDIKSVKEEVKVEEEQDIEKEITSAMRARIGHFKEQANSLTLEGVRRVLEKDLGLESFSLDVHKRFIKQCLQECFDSADEESVSRNSEENVEETLQSEKEGKEKLPAVQIKNEIKASGSEDEEKKHSSPVLDQSKQQETKDIQSAKSEKKPTEETIKNAMKKRASYFRDNSETVTMVAVRRLLEEDLKLDKNALDPYKQFIIAQLDEVLQSPEVTDSANGIKSKNTKVISPRRKSAKVSSIGSSESSGKEDEEEFDEDEVKPKRKAAPKGKRQDSEVKNRKRPAKETKTSSNKKMKPMKPAEVESSDASDRGNLSDDGHSQSSEEESVKKKREVPTPVYGKRVEHLKSVIKSCGMSVPPNVYKRVKQAPESKREASLIKELEDILGKEGLSTNPSEKEIKEVRKKKERTKELEGIDVSNIVSSSRRRSSFNFIMPPKPKSPVESDADDEEGSDNEDEEEEEDDSNSEESNEDMDEEESD